MHSYVTLRSKENGKESPTPAPHAITTKTQLGNISFYQYIKDCTKIFPNRLKILLPLDLRRRGGGNHTIESYLNDGIYCYNFLHNAI